jgi:signal transduction histidine kinase
MSKATVDVTVNDLTGLPIGEVKKRVAMLPQSAVIVYTTWTTDVAGNQYLPNEALEIIADAANRPIVIDVDNRLGHGGTGGFVAVSTLIGEEAADLVLRLFNGEGASQIPITSSDALKPIFDWRQLKRWRVNESNLPPGSEIRFRQSTTWEQYRWQIVAIAIVIILESALITWLVFEHRRRRIAEIEGRRSLMQVTQLDLALTASALSASIAHELNQPLTAIMSNTEAAEMLLAANVPDIKQVQEILADIHRDDQRATEIIRHLRKLLRHDDQEVQDVDLNELIADTMDMLEPEASGRGVVLAFDPGPHNIVCRAEPVRLQQVMLNLALNGMDAMQHCAGERSSHS